MRATLLIITFFTSSYITVKKDFKDFRNSCKIQYESSNKSETFKKIQNQFTEEFINKIIPQWYGTSWTFTGHTETPKQGSVACGYFVSTTLRDTGFNLNRYKLAQKSPLEEAQIIACGEKINSYENFDKEKIIQEINKMKNGLYFIGLDFHVGFIYKKNKEIYFIHSNYIDSKGVVKENIEESVAINSTKYHICCISENKTLMKKWILNEKLN